MSKKHNEAQIHVRDSQGQFRPGTTQPPPAQTQAETPNLSPAEQDYLSRGSGSNQAVDSLDEADVVEVLTGCEHADVADSGDPSGETEN